MKNLIWFTSLTVILISPPDIFAGRNRGVSSESAISNVSGVTITEITQVSAEEEDSDRPEWAGVPGKDGKPGRGNDTPGVSKGEDYGDLWIIYRNENGEPILDDQNCVQPIDAEGNLIMMIFVEGKCELPLGSEEDVQEISLGRLNIARSPADVLQASYDEALNTLNNAISIDIDGAGRLKVMTFDEVSGMLVDKRIDSPLENLALYKNLMLNGYLPGLEKTLGELGPLAHLQSGGDGLEETPLSQADFRQAAAFFGGAADKAGKISIDLLITINGFLGLNTKENGSYVEYYDFSPFEHSAVLRTGLFSERVETLLVVDNPNAPLMNATFHVENVNILNTSFDNLLDPYRENLFLIDNQTPYLYFDIGGAWKFAQAADDALKAVNFIHNFEVPAY